jgi:hypothetical protein
VLARLIWRCLLASSSSSAYSSLQRLYPVLRDGVLNLYFAGASVIVAERC